MKASVSERSAEPLSFEVTACSGLKLNMHWRAVQERGLISAARFLIAHSAGYEGSLLDPSLNALPLWAASAQSHYPRPRRSDDPGCQEKYNSVSFVCRLELPNNPPMSGKLESTGGPAIPPGRSSVHPSLRPV
jgi:hypothetical protein